MSKNKKHSGLIALITVVVVLAAAGVGGYYFFTTPKAIDNARAVKNLDEAVKELTFDTQKKDMEVLASVVDHNVETTVVKTVAETGKENVVTNTSAVYHKKGGASDYEMFLKSPDEEELKNGVYFFINGGKYYKSVGEKMKAPTEILYDEFSLNVGFGILIYDVMETYKVKIEPVEYGYRLLGYGLVKDNFKDGTMTVKQTVINAAKEGESVSITLSKLKLSDDSLRVRKIVRTTVEKEGAKTTTTVYTYTVTY